MLIYSVTVNIQNDVMVDWLQWMQSIHIQEVMNTKCFNSFTLRQIISPESEDESTTFNISYKCSDPKLLQEYFDNFAQELQKRHSEKYEGKFVAFRTILKDI